MHAAAKIGIATAATAVAGGATSLVTEHGNEEAGTLALSFVAAGGGVATAWSAKSPGAALLGMGLGAGAAIGAYAAGRLVLGD